MGRPPAAPANNRPGSTCGFCERDAMTNTDTSTDTGAQTRHGTEKSVDVVKNSVMTFTGQLAQFTPPTVDLTGPVARYFQHVQQAVDLNRDLVGRTGHHHVRVAAGAGPAGHRSRKGPDQHGHRAGHPAGRGGPGLPAVTASSVRPGPGPQRDDKQTIGSLPTRA